MSSNLFTLHIREPLLTKTGKVAFNRKYEVWYKTGKYSLGKFAKQADLSMCGILARVRGWPAGEYHDKFMAVLRSMKNNRQTGRYARAGGYLTCPKCKCKYARQEALFAKRRASRDASPDGSVLRAMGPAYFGEPPRPPEVPIPLTSNDLEIAIE